MNTSTLDGSSAPNAMSVASYLLFRDLATEQQRLLRLRLTTTGQAFLVLSSHDQPKFNSMYIEIGEKRVAFGKYNGATSKEMDTTNGIRGNPHLDLWLYFDDQYIYVGKDATEEEEEATLARFWAKELNSANHLGLASSGLAQWVLSEGRIYLEHSYLSVVPPARLAYENNYTMEIIDTIEAVCTEKQR